MVDGVQRADSGGNPASTGPVDLLERGADRFGDFPARVRGLSLLQIGDVAAMIPGPVLFDVLVFHGPSRDLRNQPECLQKLDIELARPLPRL